MKELVALVLLTVAVIVIGGCCCFLAIAIKRTVEQAYWDWRFRRALKRWLFSDRKPAPSMRLVK